MYMVLYRPPADREKMKRVGQRMFANHNDLFIEIYSRITDEAYGYILVDNKPETPVGHQVLSNVFDDAQRPTIFHNFFFNDLYNSLKIPVIRL